MGKAPRQTGPDADLPPLPPEVWPLIYADGSLRHEYRPSLSSETDSGNLNVVRWPDEYATYQRLHREYGLRFREAVAQDQQFQRYIAHRNEGDNP
jgi:hypothetical protein